MYEFMYVFMYKCMHVCILVCVYVCVYACVCLYVRTYVCLYVRKLNVHKANVAYVSLRTWSLMRTYMILKRSYMITHVIFIRSYSLEYQGCNHNPTPLTQRCSSSGKVCELEYVIQIIKENVNGYCH